MASARLNAVFETGRDRRLRFTGEQHGYRDPGVLLGYWFEERARAEAETEELLHKYARKELPFQKIDAYLNSLSSPVALTRSPDGFLHHGDVVRLRWAGADGRLAGSDRRRSFFLAALPQKVCPSTGRFLEPCAATGSEDSRVLARSAFQVFRNRGTISNTLPLRFAEVVQLCTVSGTGRLFLSTEPKAFALRWPEVRWEEGLTTRCLWKVQAAEKADRRRMEGRFVPANIDLVLCSLATGQLLSLEEGSVQTIFGPEREVSCFTHLDARKWEGPENRWQFVQSSVIE